MNSEVTDPSIEKLGDGDKPGDKSFRCQTIVFTKYGKDVEDDPEAVLRQIASNVDWVLGQQEMCPDTKRLHIQGMAFTKTKGYRWGFMKGNNFWKSKCQDPIKSIVYCTKEESRIAGPWEFGERPTWNVKGEKLRQQAEKNKILIEKPIVELVEEGHIAFTQMPNIIKAKNFWTMVNPGEPKKKSNNLWIHGDPGCGKTWFVKEEFKSSLYEKPMNKWWDGYKGEDFVLIDDFDRQGTCLGHYLKIWADRYFGWKAETKGGTIQPNFIRLIITSNYTPEELWGGPTGDDQLVAAITRRFKVIEMKDRELQEDIGDD